MRLFSNTFIILKNHSLQTCRGRILFLAFIYLINIIVFFPSFGHVPRSDQLIYLANTAEKESWNSLTLGSYSYDRERHRYSESQAFAFRPLFYFLLGTQKFLFGNHYQMWQITGFLLHLLVLGQLFHLLSLIRPGYGAGIVTLLFSVMLANVEMVIWSNIHLYLLFIALILYALKYFYLIVYEDTLDRNNFCRLFTALFLATFLYELGSVISFVFFIFLFLNYAHIKKRNPSRILSRNWLFLILVPLIIFILWYFIDFFIRKPIISIKSPIQKHVSLADTSVNLVKSIYFWIYSGLFADQLSIIIGQRTIMLPPLLFRWSMPFQMTGGHFWPVLLSLGLLAGCLGLFIRSFFIKQKKYPFAFLLLTTSLWLIQMLLIVFSRVNPLGLSVLGNSSYYNYFFWAYFLIILYSVLPFSLSGQFPAKAIDFAVSLLLIIFLSLNAYLSFDLNLRRNKGEYLQRILIKKAENLIALHGHEKDFSFRVDPEFDLKLPWIRDNNKKDLKTHTFMALLYPQYFNAVHPKYFITVDNKDRLLYAKAILENRIRFGHSDPKTISLLKQVCQELGAMEGLN